VTSPSVWKTIKPTAGATIAARSTFDIRGGKNPFLVDFTSNSADGCMFSAGTPTPTCAFTAEAKNKVQTVNEFKIIFFIYFSLNLIVCFKSQIVNAIVRLSGVEVNP
jgi:hypothetical protein